MKRILSVLLVVLMLVTVFSSCTVEQDDKEPTAPEDVLLKITDEKERATKLSDYCDANAETYTSYKTLMTMKMEMTVQGVRMTMDGTLEEYYSNIGTDDFCYYGMDKTTAKIPSMSSPIISQTKIEYYNNGKHYLKVDDPSLPKDQKLCAEVEREEFEEYLEDGEFDFDLNDCSSVTCNQGDDGSWTATYSGYSKKAINKFLDEMSITEGELGADVLDVKFTFTTDKDLNLTSQKIKFEFEDTTNEPILEAEIVISGINSTEPKTAVTAGFTEVDSIIILGEIEDKIKDIEDDKDGSFVLDITQNFKKGSASQAVTETDTVTYGEKDGKYFYNAKAEVSNQTYKITYENGKQKVTLGTQSQTNIQTEEQARAFINGLIRSCAYDRYLITEVIANENGTYTIKTTNPDTSAFDATMDSWKMVADSKSQIIKITFAEDGSIKEINSSLLITGRSTANGVACSITSRTIVEIK